MPASTSIRSLVSISSFKSSGLSENLILTNSFMTSFLSLSQLAAVNPLTPRPRDLATRGLVVYNSFFCYSDVISSCRFFPLVRLFYNNNKSFISDNSPYGYKKNIYKTHIINKLKIIRINGNQ